MTRSVGPVEMAQPSARDLWRAAALLITAFACLACTDAITKHLVGYLPIWQVSWLRFVTSAILVAGLTLPRTGIRLLRTGRLRMQLLRGALQLASAITFIAALRYLPLAEASAISFLSPLFVTILSIPLLGEQVGWRRWLAVSAGFVGMLFVVRPGSGLMQWGALLPLANAVVYALFQLVTRRISDTERPVTTMLYSAGFSLAILSLAMPFVWQTPESASIWLLVLLLGILTSIGHFLLIKGIELAPVSTLAPLIYCQLLFVIGLSYLVFGDLPDVWGFLGMAIIAGSGTYVLYRTASLSRRG